MIVIRARNPVRKSESRPKITKQKTKEDRLTIIKKQFSMLFGRSITYLGSSIPVVRCIVHEHLQVKNVHQDIHTDQDEAFGGEQVQEQGNQVGGATN